jgi:hypothetical protein
LPTLIYRCEFGYRVHPGEHAGSNSRPPLRDFVEKHKKGDNFSVAGDDEIGSGVLGRLAWRAGHPMDPLGLLIVLQIVTELIVGVVTLFR